MLRNSARTRHWLSDLDISRLGLRVNPAIPALKHYPDFKFSGEGTECRGSGACARMYGRAPQPAHYSEASTGQALP